MPAHAGYKEVRATSEAARENDWKLRSFGKGLHLGHFEPELIFPQPVLPAETDRRIAIPIAAATTNGAVS